MKNIFKLLAFLPLLTACDDLFEPAPENYRDKDAMYDEAAYALGILLNGYTCIPTNSWSFSDVATDDAVSNDPTNGYRKMATGSWTSSNNSEDIWGKGFAVIQYMNIMLEEADKVKWDSQENLNRMFADRTKGEAYALRGLFMYYLLRAHGGWSEDGKLLGVPIWTESVGIDADFNRSRATFEECMKQMYDDFESAEEFLPLDFNNIDTDAEVPAKYSGISKGDYNRVFGINSRLRLTKRIIEGIRARAALMAASPAYAEGNTTTWEDAANYAAQVLDRIGGVSGLDNNGLTWYNNHTEIDNLGEGSNPKEILWRNNIDKNSNSIESDNYPPTLYGSGRINPTQNLVDAFPMANGYPITDTEHSGYVATTPYESRDPRLAKYIVFNGSKMGPSETTITSVGSSTNDGVNQTETSTRTGYYMRKLLREDVNLDPLTTNKQNHYTPHIRYTEMFLSYAEAANQAWGPTGTGGHAYSAYDVIKAIRERAGVGLDNGDPYLESVKNNKDKMNELIRNERRLELCFEGFRFWDLRRWKANITETARGINLQNGAYSPTNVENRLYQEYMYYGPIPHSEILKWDALIQNKGWK